MGPDVEYPKTEPCLMAQRPPLSAVLCGNKVRLTKGVWDDGEDHHPPGWLAQTGDVLIVAEAHGSGRILAGFPGRDEYFWVLPGEYVPHNALANAPASAGD